MTFKERLIDALSRLFSSMKVITALAGFVVYLAAKKGVVLDTGDVQGVLIIFGALLGAQGLTDLGKAKAQVEAANPRPPEQVNVQAVNLDPDKTPKVGP